MLGSARLRRFTAFVGVIAAAAGSLATSAPEWKLEESVELETRLDTTQPEAAHHFSVRSSEQHATRLHGEIEWDASQSDPEAVVVIQLQTDGGEISETTREAGDLDSSFELALSPACAGEDCEQGYTVTLKLIDGWPTEHVDVRWSLRARISGEGTEEPDGAFISVSED